MHFYGITDIGLKRSINQDVFCCGTLSGGAAYAIVCDGMGGENAGNVASKLALETIQQKLQQDFSSDWDGETIQNLMHMAINLANKVVYDAAVSNPDYAGMGTTVVAAILCDSNVYVAHVGDSRAYLAYRDKFDQITKDHSVVQQLIDQGVITQRQAKTHPDRNIITRAVGVEKQVDCDCVAFAMPKDGVLLLCTDGLSNYCEADTMCALIKSEPDAAQLCRKLVQKAYAQGAGDNVTVVVSTQSTVANQERNNRQYALK